MEISKELVQEVWSLDENQEIYIRGDDVYYGNNSDCHVYKINLHELAHKCKEWAFKQGHWLDSGKEHNNWRCFIATKEEGSMMRADTEPEAIFKACQWILDNKEQV